MATGTVRFGMRTGSGVGAGLMTGSVPGVAGCGFPFFARIGSGVGTAVGFGTVGCAVDGMVAGCVTDAGVPGFPGFGGTITTGFPGVTGGVPGTFVPVVLLPGFFLLPTIGVVGCSG